MKMKKVGHYIFFIIINMSETNYYRRNRDVILNRTKYYYKKDKERVREKKKSIEK